MKRADQSKDSKATRSNALTAEIYSTHSTFNKDSESTIHLQRTLARDLKSGEMLQKVWNKWRSWDPVRMVEKILHESEKFEANIY